MIDEQEIRLLSEESDETTHQKIAEHLKDLIVQGVYLRGQRLPSVRNFANQLGVARSTVLRSFDYLASLGYLKTVHGSGSFVKEELPGDPVRAWENDIAPTGKDLKLESVLSSYGKNLLSLKDECQIAAPLNYGGPEADQTPFTIWSGLVKKHCRFRDLAKLEYEEEPFGFPPLREAYASYLIRLRAVNCTSDRLIVFSARELRMDLICKILLNPGDVVAVENPGYPSIRGRLLSYQARIAPVNVDHQGLIVDDLFKLEPTPRIVYVTPSHHEPTGAVLSISRRKQLLDWANARGVIIVEDDYDSEYRYSGRPLPSLQGMDQGDNVIHLSCLWKVLAPLERLGFLVVPYRLVKVFEQAKALVEKDLAVIDQFVLTDFINEGHLERYNRRARRLYGARRASLVRALNENFKARVKVAPESAGMDLLVQFDSDRSDEEIARQVAACGLEAISTRPYYVNSNDGKKGEFIIPFALYSERQLSSGVAALAKLI